MDYIVLKIFVLWWWVIIIISYKEIRKNVIINYNHNPYNFDINNALLDAIKNHN